MEDVTRNAAAVSKSFRITARAMKDKDTSWTCLGGSGAVVSEGPPETKGHLSENVLGGLPPNDGLKRIKVDSECRA